MPTGKPKGLRISQPFPIPASSKKYLSNLQNFQLSKTCIFLSTFTTRFTTPWPQKNHVLAPVFSKNPLKNEKTGRHTTPKKITRN